MNLSDGGTINKMTLEVSLYSVNNALDAEKAYQFKGNVVLQTAITVARAAGRPLLCIARFLNIFNVFSNNPLKNRLALFGTSLFRLVIIPVELLKIPLLILEILNIPKCATIRFTADYINLRLDLMESYLDRDIEQEVLLLQDDHQLEGPDRPISQSDCPNLKFPVALSFSQQDILTRAHARFLGLFGEEVPIAEEALEGR